MVVECEGAAKRSKRSRAEVSGLAHDMKKATIQEHIPGNDIDSLCLDVLIGQQSLLLCHLLQLFDGCLASPESFESLLDFTLRANTGVSEDCRLAGGKRNK